MSTNEKPPLAEIREVVDFGEYGAGGHLAAMRHKSGAWTLSRAQPGVSTLHHYTHDDLIAVRDMLDRALGAAASADAAATGSCCDAHCIPRPIAPEIAKANLVGG